jgi:hypothetical protein
MGVDSGEGRWCKGADEGVVVVGHCIRKHEVGEGVLAKRLKLSRHGSISGAPCKTAKGDGVEGWCSGAYEWRWWWGCVLAKREAGEGVWAKRLKPSRRGLVSGYNGAAGGGGGCCGVTPPSSRANLGVGMGGEVVWWVVVVVLTCCPGAPPVSLFLLNPLSSPLYTNPHYTPPTEKNVSKILTDGSRF